MQVSSYFFNSKKLVNLDEEFIRYNGGMIECVERFSGKVAYGYDIQKTPVAIRENNGVHLGDLIFLSAYREYHFDKRTATMTFAFDNSDYTCICKDSTGTEETFSLSNRPIAIRISHKHLIIQTPAASDVSQQDSDEKS